MSEEAREAGEDVDDNNPVIQALNEAIASGEVANPNWLEEAAKRALNRELEAAPNPLARLEELVAEFRASGNNASLAAQQAARVWEATASERQALHSAVAALPDEPRKSSDQPAKKTLWRRLTRHHS